MKRLSPGWLWGALWMLVACGGAKVQAPPTVSEQAAPLLAQVLPVDSQIEVGALENGLRYYIRTNFKPEARAELRLIVNASNP